MDFDPSVSRDRPVTSFRTLFIWECGILVVEDFPTATSDVDRSGMDMTIDCVQMVTLLRWNIVTTPDIIELSSRNGETRGLAVSCSFLAWVLASSGACARSQAITRK